MGHGERTDNGLFSGRTHYNTKRYIVLLVERLTASQYDKTEQRANTHVLSLVKRGENAIEKFLPLKRKNYTVIGVHRVFKTVRRLERRQTENQK